MFFSALLAMCILDATAATYYVTPTGVRPNDPAYPTGTYKTPQQAADVVNAGDIVYFMNGTYTPSSALDYVPVMKLYRPGTASSYITFTNYPGHTPVLQALSTGSWSIIKVMSQKISGVLYTPAYINISGLTIKGNRSAYATPPACGTAGAGPNGTGILITGPFGWDGTDQPYNALPAIDRTVANARNHVPHHINVSNCKVYDCTSSGISAQRIDFLTVESNEVFNNCWYTVDGTSGINLYEAACYSTNTALYASGHQVIVRNNRTYGNKLCAPSYDGNGIIVDDYKLQQNNDNDATWHTGGNPFLGIPYIGKTLIANNLAYSNGGSGIHIYLSQNVDILNNSAYKNTTLNTYNINGEIYIGASDNLVVKNNILYAETGKLVISLSGNTNYVSSNNIGYPSVSSTGITQIDPQYMNPGNTAAANFVLKHTSPAINQGTTLAAVPSDHRGASRTAYGTYDIGAYEYLATPGTNADGSLTAGLTFDGVDDYVEAPAISSFNNIGTGNFTIEARIKASSTNAIDAYPIIFSNRTGHSTGVTLFLHTGTESYANGKLWLNIHGINYPCSASPKLTDNLCHHVAAVRDGGTLNFYIDGVLNTSRPIVSGGDNISSTGVLRIGSDFVYPTSNFFKGDISEVRLWNSAKTATDIANTYNKTVNGIYSDLIAYWKLNEGSGQTAFSSSVDNQVNARLGSSTAADANDPLWANTCTAITKKLGSSFENPFVLDLIPMNGSVSHTANNTSTNNFDDDYGFFNDDIFYKFTIGQTSLVNISHCASGFDTYLHLTNSNHTIIASKDDNGDLCAGVSSSLSVNLSAGTYFVISEGYNLYTGNIITDISVAPSTGAPIARTAAGLNVASDVTASKNNSPSETEGVHAYPNPVQNGELNFGRTASAYSLLNATGMEVMAGTNTSVINVTELTPGIYFLRIENSVEKIIIK